MRLAAGTRHDGLLMSLWRHRALIVTLSRREVTGRYRGSMLGVFWSLLSPLLMLSVYTLVFTEFFRMRWSADSASKLDFAVALFAGLTIFFVFSECVTRAPLLVVNNANYVKKVVFPLEIFTWVTLAAAFFHYAIGLGVLLAAIVLARGSVPVTALLLPLVLLPFALFCAGVTWFVSAIGVYVRDVGQVIGLLVTALMFLSPVFFPVEVVPEQWRWLVHLNPLTLPITETRNLLVWGLGPDWASLGAYCLACAAVGWAGLWWFNKTRRGFADVL